MNSNDTLAKIKAVLERLPAELYVDRGGHMELQTPQNPFWADLDGCSEDYWNTSEGYVDGVQRIRLILDATACMATDVRELVAEYEALNKKLDAYMRGNITLAGRMIKAEEERDAARGVVDILTRRVAELEAAAKWRHDKPEPTVPVVVEFEMADQPGTLFVGGAVMDFDGQWYGPDRKPFRYRVVGWQDYPVPEAN